MSSFVWTMARGCECVFCCMNPTGRQLASGLSCEKVDIRCLRSSAAHGVYGSPPCMLRPALAKVATGGPSPMFGIIGPPSRPLGGMRLSHTPERSGFPVDWRGAGALRLGVPSALRGTSARTNDGHCADSDAASATQPARVTRTGLGSLKMKGAAAPFFRSDVGNGFGEIPAVAMEVLRVVLALAIRLVCRLGQDDGSVLSRACTVTLGILDPDLNDMRVVRRNRALGDREATVARLHLDAVIGDAQADGKTKRL